MRLLGVVEPAALVSGRQAASFAEAKLALSGHVMARDELAPAAAVAGCGLLQLIRGPVVRSEAKPEAIRTAHPLTQMGCGTAGLCE